MANYSTLKAAIQQIIKENGNNEITGNLLQQSLLSMINSLGSGYQFVGGATPATNPGTPDNNVFYLATENGTYTNFGGIVVENEIAFLAWNGTWVKTSIPKGGGNTIITNSDISTTPYLDILFDEDLALRIDIMGPYTGGTTETRCGSIIVSIKYYNDECFSDAYYYGHNLADLLTNIAIVSYGGAKYLRMVASMGLDLIAFSISPIDTNFSSAALSSESATTIQTIVPQILLLPSELKTINDQSLIGSGNINIVSPKIVTFNGGYDAIALMLGNANRTFRVDVIETNEQGDYLTRIGSLLVSCSSNGNTGIIDTASGYYYGYDKSWMIAECAIYMDDPEIYPDGNHFLIIQPNPGGFPVTLSIMPLDGLDVTVFEHNPGDEDIKVSDATIELVGKDGKMGIISQTQTWSGSGSNPRTYVMSNPVWGIIPQANIDLFEAAGAVFNELTGYFELNGLTDISYEEMKVIYINPIDSQSLISRYLSSYIPVRTTMQMMGGASDSSGGAMFELGNAFNLSNVEKVVFVRANSGIRVKSGGNMFRNAQKLRSIVNYMRYDLDNPYLSGDFVGCYSLEDVRIRSNGKNIELPDSSLLSEASLLYMINNAGTNAFTITLHASVYDKCQSGGEWYSDISTALAAHTNVSLARA